MTRIAKRCLRAALPPDVRDEVLSDLDERYEVHLFRHGWTWADRWYRRQAISLAVWGAGRWLSYLVSEVHDMRRLWHGWWQDVRIGKRSLASNPGFTAVAVLTLGLGIGGNTAVFTIVDGVLLRPLPYPEPDELVAIHETRVGQSWWSAAPVNAVAWRERSRTLDDVAWARTGRMSFLPASSAGEPEALDVAAVSWNFFDLLGVRPTLGRAFNATDGITGAPRVVILTDDTWAVRFGGDVSVLGQNLELDGEAHTVVGVLPPGGEPAFLGAHDLVVPNVLTEADLASRGRVLRVIGRLADETDLDAARSEMDVLGATLDAEAPGDQLRGWGVRLVPLKEQMIGNVRAPLLVLLGAVTFVLLVACANLSNLVLARGSARRAELALRTALGASRSDLARHLFAESLWVAALGGVLGLALASWGTRLLLALDPSALPRLAEVETDGRVLFLTAVITILTAALFGLAPSVRTARLERQAGGFHRGARRSETRLRSVLVAAEVGLVVLLLVGAGMMLRSLSALGAVDPGFETDDRIAVRLSLPSGRYPDGQASARFVSELTERARAIPGVVAAGTVTTLPLSGGPGYTALQVVRSHPPPEPGSEPQGGMEIVSPGYFEAMAIRLLSGRDFTEADTTSDLPTVVVDEALVERAWNDGERDPLTDAIRMAPPGAGGAATWREIVGVVGAVRYGLDADPRPRIYIAEGQVSFTLGPRTLVVRLAPVPGDRDEAAIVAALRTAVREIDPLLPIERIERLGDISRGSIARTRFQTTLLGVFAAIALSLGAVGVYGVVSYNTARRAPEMGLRLALGASRTAVVEHVLREALMPVLLGLSLGLAAATGLARVLSSMTYGVEALEPLNFASAAATIVVVATVAALLPGLRASRVDPVKVLAAE